MKDLYKSCYEGILQPSWRIYERFAVDFYTERKSAIYKKMNKRLKRYILKREKQKESVKLDDVYKLCINRPIKNWFLDIANGKSEERPLKKIYVYKNNRFWKILADSSNSPPQNSEGNAIKPPLLNDLLVAREDLEKYEDYLKKEKPSSPSAEQSVKNSLLIMILGMAISKYKYKLNGSRNKATGANPESIHADLARLGLNLDADTIRKYLQEANEMYGEKIKSKNA